MWWMWTALALAGAPAAEADALAKRFLAAIEAGRWSEAETMCSPAFLDREKLSCRRLLQEVQRGGITLQAAGSTGSDRKAVTAFWAMAEKGTELIYLVAEQHKRGWRWVDGADERRADLLGQPLPIPGPQEGIAAEFSAVIDVLGSHDPARLDALCTERLRRARFNCAEISSRITPEISLRPMRVFPTVTPGRAVLQVGVTVKGKLEDELLLYLQQDGERWLLAGADESPSHAWDYNQGTLPAIVESADLVDDAGVRLVADVLVEIAAGREPAAGVPWIPGDEGDPRVMWGEAPFEVSTLWARHLPGSDRYVICHLVRGEPSWTSWRQDPRGWVFVGMGYLGFAEGPPDCGIDAIMLSVGR